MRVREAMTSPAVTVGPEATLKEAAQLLAGHRISALPVVDAGGRPVGIVSEADLVALEAGADPRLHLIPAAVSAAGARRVADVMSAPVVTVDADADIGLAAERMLEAGVKRLPVVEREKLVGILSRHDLIKLLAGSDDLIRSQVESALAEEGLRGLVVRVVDGIAEFAGDVDPADLQLAEVLARTVPGVLGVSYRAVGSPAAP
jgi:CBS domain-containing protein